MLNQSLIPELQHETASTRKMLERVPFDQWNWKPHPKSYTLGQLALHIATIPEWMTVTINTDELDFSKGDYRHPVPDSIESLLKIFDGASAKARQALQEANDENLLKPWTLRNGDHLIFTLPRIATLRSFVMNHLIHHRGQLSVYLRLLDVPVPGMYGPSADER